ncbi:protein of unknown function (plasmid) [Cupriavidus taiwanensis]|uniref:Uncharacterized protein n=1 Tax=Cupriavidus taiwanensis TaxID=164546 RepID=A0A375IR58_9BURK|nr:protein of unknown function [Cupriavidus taiwanensis]
MAVKICSWHIVSAFAKYQHAEIKPQGLAEMGTLDYWRAHRAELCRRQVNDSRCWAFRYPLDGWPLISLDQSPPACAINRIEIPSTGRLSQPDEIALLA